MPTEFPMNDPQAIWQNQPTERFKMKAEELRRQARVIPPNGVITTEHISGRRNIWMDKNNLIKRATCG